MARRRLTSNFSSLPDAEKNRIFAEIESKTPEQILAESRPLNATERAFWKRIKKKMGRPKVGKGSKIITMSIELDLLRRATQFAKSHGLNRSALIAQGLETVMRKRTG
jgi:hypothetical protein